MILLQTILENVQNNDTLIVVDVQPEYEKSIHFIPSLVNEVNTRSGGTVFLYNGYETLGMINESDYKMWWIDHGLDYEIIDRSIFYDKGYAFFRYCMDSGGLADDTISNFVRFMYDNKVNDSRDMDRNMWAKYLRQYRKFDRKEVFELLRHSEDCVHIPDLMDFIRRFRNITLCGGGVNECLREVEISLKALKIPYNVDHRFTY